MSLRRARKSGLSKSLSVLTKWTSKLKRSSNELTTEDSIHSEVISDSDESEYLESSNSNLLCVRSGKKDFPYKSVTNLTEDEKIEYRIHSQPLMQRRMSRSSRTLSRQSFFASINEYCDDNVSQSSSSQIQRDRSSALYDSYLKVDQMNPALQNNPTLNYPENEPSIDYMDHSNTSISKETSTHYSSSEWDEDELNFNTNNSSTESEENLLGNLVLSHGMAPLASMETLTSTFTICNSSQSSSPVTSESTSSIVSSEPLTPKTDIYLNLSTCLPFDSPSEECGYEVYNTLPRPTATGKESVFSRSKSTNNLTVFSTAV